MTVTQAAATPVGTDADRALVRLGTTLRELGYAFVTVTPATHERVNRRPENAFATGLRDVFGWSRPFRAEVVPHRILTLMDEAGVLDHDERGWRSRVRFSSYDGELLVHSAFPPSERDTVFLGPDTYRMADAAVAHVAALPQPPRRVADIGCGTGAGAIAVAKRAPGAEVLAVDINPAALRYTAVNAALAGTANVRPCRSDLLTGVTGRFDLIVSNPPFMVDPAGRAYRDGGGPDGNALTLAVLDEAAARLAPGGTLVLFSGTGVVAGEDPLRRAAAERLAGTGLDWTYAEVDPDVYDEELDGPAYGQAERIAVVLLTATRPG